MLASINEGNRFSVAQGRVARRALARVTRRSRTRLAGVLVLAALLTPLGGSVLAAQLLRLGEHEFDWSTVEQERVHFRWSAEVINDRTRAFDVEVAIDLLDDDDGVLHTDTGTVTVVAGEVVTLEQEGSMPFAGAANVVSFRFRLLPSPPASRRQP